MLTKNQWLWCAEHHKQIGTATTVVVSVLLLAYCYVFVDRFFWQRNVPVIYRPTVSQMAKFGCNTDEVYEMFIPSAKKEKIPTNSQSPMPELLKVRDARTFLLEFYGTSMVGSEILEKSPKCLGAYIADKQHYPEPYALLVVDRGTGKTIFRIARLQDYLTR